VARDNPWIETGGVPEKCGAEVGISTIRHKASSAIASTSAILSEQPGEFG
jgi:hypothetical protein